MSAIFAQCSEQGKVMILYWDTIRKLRRIIQKGEIYQKLLCSMMDVSQRVLKPDINFHGLEIPSEFTIAEARWNTPKIARTLSPPGAPVKSN